MPSFKDLTGQKYGRLYVVRLSKKEIHGNRSRYFWLCQCECGNQCEVRTDCLTTGNTESCGCLRKEVAVQNVSAHHSHKMSGTRLYHTWQAMKARCLNPNNPRYRDYGGRGITICDEWMRFENFESWAIKNGYADHLSIDRINNDKGYFPDNCRWTNMKTQARNRRSNVKVPYNGKDVTLTEISQENGINFTTLRARKKHGKKGEELLVAPRVLKTRRVIYDGAEITLRELSEKTGINVHTLHSRYTSGKRGNELIKK